jgi:hypothetical protein
LYPGVGHVTFFYRLGGTSWRRKVTFKNPFTIFFLNTLKAFITLNVTILCWTQIDNSRGVVPGKFTGTISVNNRRCPFLIEVNIICSAVNVPVSNPWWTRSNFGKFQIFISKKPFHVCRCCVEFHFPDHVPAQVFDLLISRSVHTVSVNNYW